MKERETCQKWGKKTKTKTKTLGGLEWIKCNITRNFEKRKVVKKMRMK